MKNHSKTEVKKGLFITIEALDFAGKTTQIEKLKNWFGKMKLDAVFTREPGGTIRGESIREIILNLDKEKPLNPVTECYLYAAARSILVEELIKPGLTKGEIIISDRFLDSSLAYQGVGRGLGVSFVEKINQAAGVDILPDVTIFLDGDPNNLQNRIEKERELDRIEKEGAVFQTLCRKGFYSLIEKDPNRFKVVDASKKPDEVFADIKNVLEPILVKWQVENASKNLNKKQNP